MSFYVFWHYIGFPFLPASHSAQFSLLFRQEVSLEEVQAAVRAWVCITSEQLLPTILASKQATKLENYCKLK